MAIIIYLEKHRTTTTLNFIKRASGSKTIFCLEDASDTYCEDHSLEKLIASQNYFLENSAGNSYYSNYCKLFYNQLNKHKNTKVYNVDSTFLSKEGKDKMERFIKSNPMKANQRIASLMFFREKQIANNMIKLQTKYPDMDIVLIIGSRHATVLYHLLAMDVKHAYFIKGDWPGLIDFITPTEYFDGFNLPFAGMQDDPNDLFILSTVKKLMSLTHSSTSVQQFKYLYSQLNKTLERFHDGLTCQLKLMHQQTPKVYPMIISDRLEKEFQQLQILLDSNQITRIKSIVGLNTVPSLTVAKKIYAFKELGFIFVLVMLYLFFYS